MANCKSKGKKKLVEYEWVKKIYVIFITHIYSFLNYCQ